MFDLPTVIAHCISTWDLFLSTFFARWTYWFSLLDFNNVATFAVILFLTRSVAKSSLTSILQFVPWIPASLANHAVSVVDFVLIAMNAHDLIALSSLKAFSTVVFSFMRYILGTLFALSFIWHWTGLFLKTFLTDFAFVWHIGCTLVGLLTTGISRRRCLIEYLLFLFRVSWWDFGC